MGPDVLHAANASYLRNLLEMFALPGWTRARIIARVSTTGEEVLRRTSANGVRWWRCRTAATGIWPERGPVTPGCR